MTSEFILYEDNHLIIINKKPGELAQGDKTGDESLLDAIKDFIKTRDQKPGNVFLGLIHRLDRPTSGILVFAKTSKALSRMNNLFKNRELEKIYWAIVSDENNMLKKEPEKKLIHYLKKNSKNNKTTVFSQPTQDAKKAILTYSLLAKLDNYSLLQIELETGRSHQIRAQLSKQGLPIKGDLKYGSARTNKDGSIHLHARKLTFTHPIKNIEIEVIAPIPENDSVWAAAEKIATS